MGIGVRGIGVGIVPLCRHSHRSMPDPAVPVQDPYLIQGLTLVSRPFIIVTIIHIHNPISFPRSSQNQVIPLYRQTPTQRRQQTRNQSQTQTRTCPRAEASSSTATHNRTTTSTNWHFSTDEAPTAIVVVEKETKTGIDFEIQVSETG